MVSGGEGEGREAGSGRICHLGGGEGGGGRGRGGGEHCIDRVVVCTTVVLVVQVELPFSR